MLLRLQRYDLRESYHCGTDEMHIADMPGRAYLEGKPSVGALQFQNVESTDELSVSPECLEAQCCKAFVRLLTMVGLTGDLC